MLGVFFKNHREVDHSKIRLPRVLIKMKRKIDLVEEEHESEDEEKESSSEERKDEEPRIKDGHLSQAVSEKRTSELLHIMAASKDIIFWAPRGQLLQNKGIIPVTNIAELVEYAILPHNDNFTKPRALNTFLNGGFNQEQNVAKWFTRKLEEKSYRNAENTSENESNNEKSSTDIENQEEVEEEEEEEVASENGVEAEDIQESDNDTENDSQETESSSPETSTTFHDENPCEQCENSWMCTGHWSRNVLNAFGTITTTFVLYAITWSPRRWIAPKRAFFGVTVVEQLHTKRENVGNQFLFPF